MKDLARFQEGPWRLYAESQDHLNEGDFYVSVTSILSVAVPEKLQDYMKKNSANAQKKRLAETANIGTEIHELIEKDLKGLDFPVPEQYQAPFDKWTELRFKHNIEATYTEQLVYSEKGYAGTADIIGPYEGKECLMDIKTGFFSVKAGWQMAAYRRAAIELGLLTEEAGMVGINVKRDGSVATPFVYQHFDFCEDTFLATLQVFKGLYFNQLNKLKWKYLK